MVISYVTLPACYDTLSLSLTQIQIAIHILNVSHKVSLKEHTIINFKVYSYYNLLFLFLCVYIR